MSRWVRNKVIGSLLAVHYDNVLMMWIEGRVDHYGHCIAGAQPLVQEIPRSCRPGFRCGTECIYPFYHELKKLVRIEHACCRRASEKSWVALAHCASNPL